MNCVICYFDICTEIKTNIAVFGPTYETIWISWQWDDTQDNTTRHDTTIFSISLFLSVWLYHCHCCSHFFFTCIANCCCLSFSLLISSSLLLLLFIIIIFFLFLPNVPNSHHINEREKEQQWTNRSARVRFTQSLSIGLEQMLTQSTKAVESVLKPNRARKNGMKWKSLPKTTTDDEMKAKAHGQKRNVQCISLDSNWIEGFFFSILSVREREAKKIQVCVQKRLA